MLPSRISDGARSAFLPKKRDPAPGQTAAASRPSSPPKHEMYCCPLWELIGDCLWLQLHLPQGLWTTRGILNPTQLIEQCCPLKPSPTHPIHHQDLHALIKAFTMGSPSFASHRGTKRDRLDPRTTTLPESLKP